MVNTQNSQGSAYSAPTPPARTLEEFRIRVTGMTEDNQLTVAGKDLVKGYYWKFAGEEYRLAWRYLFNRAGQLGLTYCKHFKRFYKPLPPKPAVGDRVRLTSTGATGIVTGYSRFNVTVSIDQEQREAEVSVEYLEKI
ncbi:MULTISPECIES: hypothetical protein [Spirosoma]|uniref:Uncharacterized protein n=1 Tax=Spirosoma liriopis TaxID=2937440 RepID=A0ABT0HTM3_9BACT|nr:MULTISPECIES: hypothetical protein [Spirosoma]MCK8495558.1 hypothetical protein [Spirosoma liriopis]UHG94576.1 hypothetical protein LQ777_27890 [Spirosoma oryzicola]